MGLRIYGEGRTQIPLSSPATIGPLARIQDRQGLTIANNNKIKLIMISFTDHYNAIPIDRFPSKTKIGKDSWYFNNSLLCKPEFSSATKNSFLFETHKKTTLQEATGGNTANLVLKRMPKYFLKTQPLKKIVEFKDRICFFY